jgi:S1-C subfamily serine protease
MRALAVAVAAVALAGCGGAGGAPPPVLAVRGPDAEATGFAIGGGRVLTVAHVLRGGRAVSVGDRRARVLRVDRRDDVAVLASGDAPAARAGAAREGDRVTVRVLREGAVRSLRATVRRRITAHVSGEVRPALELAAAVMPGDSGAPVVDGRGQVVGVVFAQAAGGEALAYALDARALGPLLAP